MCTRICYFNKRLCSCSSLDSEVLKFIIKISFYVFFISIMNSEGANHIKSFQSQVGQIWMKSHRTLVFAFCLIKVYIAGFNLPITMWMRWVWLGHISKCEPHSSKLGVQYGPPAYGRRSILHPQFLRIRLAFTGAPSLDSWHSSIVIR